MNKRLALTTNSPTADGAGGLVDVYTTAITVWGAVEPLTGYEKSLAMGIDATLSHKIGIRYNSRFNPRGVVTYNSRSFKIHSVVNEDEANRKIVMLATEVL
jgi:SPP1 family predicted phage head-tail adaptor